jgi:transposase
MMSGAIWVRHACERGLGGADRARGQCVGDVAPLACKTDKVDARVLAELCRRDLVPELWVPALADRELRERLRRRMHLVRRRASAMNRIFGLLTQWGPAALTEAAARTPRDDAARAMAASRRSGGARLPKRSM